MFSIEHEFASTIITLVDEGTAQSEEDLIINSFFECVTIEQYDARTDNINKITFSMAQIKDLSAAINLPEGVYSRFSRILPLFPLAINTQRSSRLPAQKRRDAFLRAQCSR